MAKASADLLYTKNHEWVHRLDDGRVRIGLTDFVQQALGDIVFIELPEEGALLQAAVSMGSVESVKAVSDLTAPVTGKVVIVNRSLEENPAAVNRDPYGEGWIAELELHGEQSLNELLTREEYEAYIAEDE